MSEVLAGTPALWRHAEFRRGAREMVGIALGISAWGVVAGVAMANSSLGTAWAVVMSLVVFSGTGQIASLPLISSFGSAALASWKRSWSPARSPTSGAVTRYPCPPSLAGRRIGLPVIV